MSRRHAETAAAAPPGLSGSAGVGSGRAARVSSRGSVPTANTFGFESRGSMASRSPVLGPASQLGELGAVGCLAIGGRGQRRCLRLADG